jgi:tRNA (guanine-N7-)-methyltransferase
VGKRVRRHVDPFQCRISVSPESWLGRYRDHGEGDIWLDLGCGKGEFFAGLAERHPDIFFIGVEIRGKIAEAYFAGRMHLPNLVLLHGNVNLSIPSMMDDHKVQKIFIHFPDPYTRKDRYRKRRMLNQTLVEGICEILAPGGTASVKTDDRILFDEMDAMLSMRLDSVGLPDAQQAGGAFMSEWEEDCRRKSVPVYSREYRLGMVDPATKSPSHKGTKILEIREIRPV